MRKQKSNDKLIKLVDLLIKNKLTISTCESATCGNLAAEFGKIPGVSATYLGGLITYSNQAKVILAGVNYQTINNTGAISHETASEMALNTSELLNANISVSITGNAGPSNSENKPNGLFYIGLSVFKKVDTYEFKLDSKLNRQEMINEITNKAIEVVYNIVSLIE